MRTVESVVTVIRSKFNLWSPDGWKKFADTLERDIHNMPYLQETAFMPGGGSVMVKGAIFKEKKLVIFDRGSGLVYNRLHVVVFTGFVG